MLGLGALRCRRILSAYPGAGSSGERRSAVHSSAPAPPDLSSSARGWAGSRGRADDQRLPGDGSPAGARTRRRDPSPRARSASAERRRARPLRRARTGLGAEFPSTATTASVALSHDHQKDAGRDAVFCWCPRGASAVPPGGNPPSSEQARGRRLGSSHRRERRGRAMAMPSPTWRDRILVQPSRYSRWLDARYLALDAGKAPTGAACAGRRRPAESSRSDRLLPGEGRPRGRRAPSARRD